MNVENAEKAFQDERRAYWGGIKNPKEKRREQNRINKYISRRNAHSPLETAHDYLILAHKLKAMRENQTKKRKGKPRRSEEWSKRRASPRLAEKHQKADKTKGLEVESFLGSAKNLGFDRIDNIPPPEEDINIITETASSRSLGTPIDEPRQCLSNEISRAPESIPSSFFHLCTSQASSQNSNIDDETWYHSVNDINNPASITTMLQSEMNFPGERWVGFLQEDICGGNPMDFNWEDDLSNLDGPLGDGDKWNRANVFEPEPHQLAFKTSELALASQEDLLLPPDKAGDGIQQLTESDQAQLYTTMTDLNSQLQRKRGQSIPNRPVPARKPLLAERNDLALLIEQCLNSLKEATARIPGSKIDETGLEDGRMFKRDGKDMELQMAVNYLWNTVRAGPYHIPSLGI